MRLLQAFILIFSSVTAHAAAPTLENLSSEAVDNVLKTFGGLTNFRALEPAGAWADFFGVSVGVVAQASPTKRVKAVIPNSGDIPSYLPDGNAVLALQAPWGLGLELGFFPTTKIKDFRLRQYAGNVKWTVNKVFLQALPVDIALRAGLADSYVNYKYTYLALQDDIEYRGRTWNFSLSVGKRLWIFEPYVGAGYATNTAKLSNEGRVTLLGNEFSLRSNVERRYNSFVGTAGVQIHLFFMNLTAQADYQFGMWNYAAKIAAKF